MKWIFRRHLSQKGRNDSHALARATGDTRFAYDDADLEYNPSDLVCMMRVFIDKDAAAAYGSRFAGGGVR